MSLLYDRFDSPIGRITAVVHGDALVALDFADCMERYEHLLAKRFGPKPPRKAENPIAIRDRVTTYFDGRREAFDGLGLESRGTPFQERVWRELGRIPWGETRSYAALAAAIGKPRAVRAVARANALNPIAIIVPCHRVIGKNGALTGYAGGLARKRWLLRHEGALLA